MLRGLNVAQSQRRGNGAGDQRRVGQLGQLDQPAAVGVAGDVIAHQLLRQARLADAARTDEGEQGRRRQHPVELGQLLLAADKAGQRPRQVVLRSLEAAVGGERRLSGAVDRASALGRAALDQCLERLAVRPDQAECAHEQRNRVTSRDVRAPALQLADAARADAGAFGQLLLGQAGGASMVAQELAKASRRVVRRHAGHCRR